MSRSSEIAGRIEAVRRQLPDGTRLVAVSKYHPEEDLLAAYGAGQRIFGESHVQELTRKHEALPADIEWHFIGHLQTNKVKYIAPFVSMIDAVDSWHLMVEINRQAEKCGRVIPVLLELHIAEEETKYGFSPVACREMLAEGAWRDLRHIRIAGLMMMASNVDDEAQIRQEFLTARQCFDELKSAFFADDAGFSERSWGMTHDYPLAVECGSTMVRVGTGIFGERNYFV